MFSRIFRENPYINHNNNLRYSMMKPVVTDKMDKTGELEPS
jgi:hypothetical protein